MEIFKKVLTNQFLFVIMTLAEREYLRKRAAMAQLVEHILGKDEVPSSNLGSSSKKRSNRLYDGCFFFLAFRGCEALLC